MMFGWKRRYQELQKKYDQLANTTMAIEMIVVKDRKIERQIIYKSTLEQMRLIGEMQTTMFDHWRLFGMETDRAMAFDSLGLEGTYYDVIFSK